MKEEPIRQIVYNSVECLDCNEILISRTRHDYQVCSCPNHASVDGGMSYQRVGARDLSRIRKHVAYADDDFKIVRQLATRGSRGKSGDEPLTWVPLCEMSDQYLEAVLVYGGAAWHLELITKELQYRHKHGISISET